jgi:hypothetical protein
MGLFLYFLRHGETAASQAGGFCGSLDPELTPKGCLMAEDFAHAYASLPWAAIFSNGRRLYCGNGGAWSFTAPDVRTVIFTGGIAKQS